MVINKVWNECAQSATEIVNDSETNRTRSSQTIKNINEEKNGSIAFTLQQKL